MEVRPIISNVSTLKNTGFHQLFVDLAFFFFFCCFYPQYLSKSYVQRLLKIPFSARNRWDLPRLLKDISQTVTNALLLSGENNKDLAISDILKAITVEVNMITTQMAPFFSSTL